MSARVKSSAAGRERENAAKVPNEMNMKAATLMGAAAFLLLSAVLVGADQLYFMGAVVVSVAIVARLAVWGSLRGLRSERRVVDRVAEGEWVSVFLSVSNPTRLPKFFLALEDKASPWLEAEDAKFFLPALWPGQTVTLEYRTRGSKRGKLRVGPLQVNASDPIGLLSRSISLEQTSTAMIYPRPLLLPRQDLGGAVSFGGGSAERAARAGEGLDFHGIRDYQPGDELRRIHWKATARHQRLAVIQFDQSYTADLAIALDLLQGTEVGEGKETTLEYAVKIAVSLARRALDNGASVSLSVYGAEGPRSAVCRREEEFHGILELLATAEAHGKAPAFSLAEAMRTSLSPGTALVVITSDPDTRLVSLANTLAAQNINLALVLLDASTFARRPQIVASSPTAPRRKPLPFALNKVRGWLFETEEEISDAPSPARTPEARPASRSAYLGLAESLRQNSAKAQIIGRGEDLAQAVRRIMGAAE